jgi:hypothetical protein
MKKSATTKGESVHSAHDSFEVGCAEPIEDPA